MYFLSTVFLTHFFKAEYAQNISLEEDACNWEVLMKNIQKCSLLLL